VQGVRTAVEGGTGVSARGRIAAAQGSAHGGKGSWRRRGPRVAEKDHKREGSGVAEEKEKEERYGDGWENDSLNTKGLARYWK
jgi:hypothetical protein